GGAALLAFDFLRGAPKDHPRPRRVKKRGSREPFRMPGWSGWLLLLPWTWLLWKLETRTRFLGDGTVWLKNLQLENPNPFSEPLASATWNGYAGILRALKLPVDPVTAGILPILCGVIAAALFWGIASEIAPKTGSRAFAFAALATLGVVQLYFGYIESYPPVSVAILIYLWLGRRQVRGAGHALWTALALAVAIASHLACVFLVPSFLYLLLRREKWAWPKRVLFALLPPVGAAAILVALGYPPSKWQTAFRIAAGAVEPGHAAALYARPYGEISIGHAWDVLNAILLALPVPALLLLAALAGAAAPPNRKESAFRDPASIFLALAALPGLLLAAALVLPVAPAQDWDLTAILLLPLAVFGVGAGFSIPKLPLRGVRAAAVALLGAGALLSFVLVNADEEASLRRFETLVGPGSRITNYGKAYGNEILETFDAERRDFPRALIHAQRALDAEPTNPRYWTKKGAALYELNRFDEAIPVLEEGLRRGPRHDGYYNLGNCFVRVRRYAEAEASYRQAIRLTEPRPDYINNLAVALYHEGKTDSARVLWTDVVRRWPDYTRASRSLLTHFGNGAADSGRVSEPD
ncbi:MAG TPA: tetratricopeptide repeat protein, partial [Candidatus Binatia bacterium]|nr:tetratricopeptide repeat protein [Candidatus Binatia bacterium]